MSLFRFAADFLQGKPSVKRSPLWPALEKKHLKEHPYCEVCGEKEFLEVHHVVPVHIAPIRELDPTNLMTACRRKWWSCHLQLHGGNWKMYRPDARVFAAKILAVFKAASGLLP